MSGVLESLNQVSGAAMAAVLNSLWQAAAVAAAAWAAMRFVPRINAATRHLVWWAVLAVILVLPAAPAILASWQATSQLAPQQQGAGIPSAAFEVASDPASGMPRPTPTHSVVPPAPLELRAGAWPTWIAAVWSAVLLLQLGRIAWSFAYLRQVKRRAHRASPELRRSFDAWMMSCGVHRPARLLVSSEIVSPMAVGFRHPAVILPASLLDQFQEPELDHVLLHELAHIARQDDWLNLWARLASAVLALHPVAAWVLRHIEREREIACDDWVVSMTGAARPYAASLARLFEVCFARRRMMLASGMAGRASHLGERIEMLLHRSRDFTPKASIARVVLSTMVLVIFAIAGAQAPRWLAFAQETPAFAETPAVSQGAALAEAQEQTPPAAPRASAAPRAAETPRPAIAAETPGAQVAPAAPATPRPDIASTPFQSPAPAAATPKPGQNTNGTPNGSFLAALVAAGYGNLTVDEIINLKNAGVTAQFLTGMNQSGWGKLTVQEMIDLSHRGVNPEYVRKIKEAGIRDVTLKEVMDLATYGVRPETVQEIHSLGFGPYTAKQAIQFAQYGMRTDLFRALKDSGLGNAALGDILEAHTVGLNARDLREAKQYGPSLTLKQIIKLKMAGVI
jgi:beta-lactamase regulating signal transducer with metallopeptidase domain